MQILNVVLTERQHAWPYCFTSNCVWCRAAWPRQNFTIVNKQQLPSLVTWHSAHVTSHRHSCPIRRPQARMVVQDKDKHNKASPLVQIPETSYVVSKVLWIKCACKFVKEIESLPDATIIYPGTLLAHSPSCAHTHRAIRSITRKKQQFPCPTTVLDCSFKSFSVMSPTTELGVPSAAYTNEIPSHSNTRQNSDAFFPAHRDAFLVEMSMSASMTECKHFSKLNL